MCCNTKPGPALALAAFEKASGVHVTAGDWHLIREGAKLENGGTLSRRRVTKDEARKAAEDFARDVFYLGKSNGVYDAAEADALAKKFVEDFVAQNNTEGTLQTLEYLDKRVPVEELATPPSKREQKGYLGRPWVFPKPADEADEDEDLCSECGADLSDNEGYDGLCGNCADKAEEEGRWDDYYDQWAKDSEDEEAAAVAAEVAVESDAPPAVPGARFVGKKFTGWRDGADIAKDIRGDIKAAVKAGDLPKDVKVSVKTHKYAGGQAIDVKLSGWPESRVYADRSEYGRHYTDEARAVLDKVEAMREAYNADSSQPQFDYFNVIYYGNTSWE